MATVRKDFDSRKTCYYSGPSIHYPLHRFDDGVSILCQESQLYLFFESRQSDRNAGHS